MNVIMKMLSLKYRHRIQQEDYRPYVAYNLASYLAAMGHLFFVVIFLFLNIPEIVLTNIVSVVFYSVLNILNKKGYHGAVCTAAVIEVIGHAGFIVYLIGYDCGFSYYIFLLIPLLIFAPFKRSYIKKICLTMVIVALVGIKALEDNVSAIVNIKDEYLQLIYYFNVILNVFCLGAISHFYVKAVEKVEGKMSKVNNKLTILANIDSLTKLYNRRMMREKLEEFRWSAKKFNSSFCIVLCDVDDFKKFNDKYGHECGDYILKKVAGTLKNALREGDYIGRWGGEEFLILLRDLSLSEAEIFSNNLKQKINDSIFEYEDNQFIITITFGVSKYENGTSIDLCINKADRAMYVGKNRSKNCVVAAN